MNISIYYLDNRSLKNSQTWGPLNKNRCKWYRYGNLIDFFIKLWPRFGLSWLPKKAIIKTI